MKKQLAFLVLGLVFVLVLSGQLARAASKPAATRPRSTAWTSPGIARAS